MKSKPVVLNHLKDLVKTNPIHRISDQIGLGWGLRICISNKFLGNVNAAGSEATLRTVSLK